MANNFVFTYSSNNFPNSFPMSTAGKLNCKVRLKTDQTKADGTNSVYLQITLNRVVKKITLGFSVLEKEFDIKNQRVKSSNKYFKNYNLLIEKKLADINTIEVNYRLGGKVITIESLMQDLNNPTARIDFIKFWSDEMKRQKEILKSGTYRQQMTVLNKVKGFKNPLFFYEIDQRYVEDLKTHCKKKLKNNNNTIATTIKSLKKYLRIANKRGIITPLDSSDIKNTSFKGNRTFLLPEEIRLINEYWDSKFVPDIYKNMVARFLFSCFTGMRFTDVQKLTAENFINGSVVFTAEKNGKFQRIKLNETAKKYLYDDFFKINSTNEYTNRELKKVAKLCGISKKLTFHVGRHTFATNFLMCGGRLEHLQKVLAHSKIEETMIYVGIVENITNVQIMNMDEILNNYSTP